MSTLLLSAPKGTTQLGSGFYKDFYTILNSGVGPDYAIFANLIGHIHPGDKVIVFDRDRQLQAEGVLVKDVETGKSPQGVQRYDVRISSLMAVPDTNPPRVNRFGV
jgi:hypothetical protein